MFLCSTQVRSEDRSSLQQNFECGNETNGKINFNEVALLQNSHANWNIYILINIIEWESLLLKVRSDLDEVQAFVTKKGFREYNTRIEDLRRRATDIEKEAIFFDKNRNRRQILQGVGTFLGSLFGILTFQDKVHIYTDLHLLNERTKATITLLDSHTSVLKSLIDNSKQFADKANRNMENLSKSISAVKVANKALADRMAINNYLWEMGDILREIQRRFSLIFNAIQVKRLNPILINVKDLKNLLIEISSNSSEIPFELSEIEKYYYNLVLKVHIFKDYITFSWEIPMKDPIKYAVYKVTPVPWVENGTAETFEFQTDLIIVSQFTSFLYKMSDLTNDCSSYDNVYLCKDIVKKNKFYDENECILNTFVNDSNIDVCTKFKIIIPEGNSVVTRLTGNEWKVIPGNNNSEGMVLKLKCALKEYDVVIMKDEFCVKVVDDCIISMNQIEFIPLKSFNKTIIARFVPKYKSFNPKDYNNTIDVENKIPDIIFHEVQNFSKIFKEIDIMAVSLNKTIELSLLVVDDPFPWFTFACVVLASCTSILTACIIRKKAQQIIVHYDK